jgi:hypothetical protein
MAPTHPIIVDRRGLASMPTLAIPAARYPRPSDRFVSNLVARSRPRERAESAQPRHPHASW